METMSPSFQDPRTFAIIGAAYEVHRVLGTGFLEIFYKDDHAQVLSYLASTKLRCGLLLNFGTAKLEHKRFIWTPRSVT